MVTLPPVAGGQMPNEPWGDYLPQVQSVTIPSSSFCLPENSFLLVLDPERQLLGPADTGQLRDKTCFIHTGSCHLKASSHNALPIWCGCSDLFRVGF